jgi:hypothetical protein
MMTFEQWMNRVVEDSDGCWYYAPPSTCWNYIEYKGKKSYIIEAIFDYYGKVYDGVATRNCNHNRCVNPSHMMNKVEGFWFHVDIRKEDECWEWKSLKGTSRYGLTKRNGKNIRSHRLAYELFYDTKIPEDMEACHKCDNPPCCNPTHLFLGTHQDNVNDREQKGRNKLPHSVGEEHGSHKLTKEDVLEIRKLYSSGNHSYRSLSGMFDVTFGCIRLIVKRRNWRWLT